MIQFSLTQDTFAQEYRERRFLLLRGAADVAGFSLSDLDGILHGTEPTAPFLRLHSGGGFVPEDQFVEVFNDIGSTRRRIIRPRLYGMLREGATLILNRVDNRHPLLRTLCLDVAQFTAQNTLGNGYAAFGHKASFGKHWDCHDVFAVQLYGRKRWQLFKPTMQLPLSHQTSAHAKADCPTEAELDIILERGDVLYIPRGWWHCATPIGEPTFHVAIGVHPPVVSEYLSWVCGNKLAEHLNCRRSLSFTEDNHAHVLAALEDLLHEARDAANLAEYLGLIGASDRVQTPFNLAAAIGQVSPALTADSLVRLNAVYPRRADGAGGLIINGEQVALSDSLRPVLSALAAAAGHCLPLSQLPDAGERPASDVVRELLALDLVQVTGTAG